MKKIKIFLVMIAIMAVSLTYLTAQVPVEKKEAKEAEVVCVPYSIVCDGGSFYGTVCGTSTEEIIDKVWRISIILCGW